MLGQVVFTKKEAKVLQDQLQERYEKQTKELIDRLTEKPQTIINNNIQNINNIKIVIVKRGEERIDHITEEKLLKILDQDFNSAMRELMRLIYFNKDVPENSHWCVLYPNQEYGALQYNCDTEIIERWVTDQILIKNFDNMLSLLSEKMDAISRCPNLNINQKHNVNKFFHHFGLDDFSVESPEGLNYMKMTAYNNRFFPIKMWKQMGIMGEHNNLKGFEYDSEQVFTIQK